MAFGKIELKPLPPKEALEYWEDKIRLSPGEFYALSEEARLRAFAVSGIAKGDELETVYNALRTALEKGITFKKFQEMAKDVFERRGWTGKRAWRVKTIFRTNIQTAYSMGRYKRYQEASEERPYWMYDAINDSRTRPTHAALDGKVFPAGHKFWDTWWPPNGFNCRCSVISLTKQQVEKRGLKVEKDDLTGSLIEPVDPVSGARLPARPLVPDPGWDHHPGKSVWGGITPRELEPGKLRDIGPRDFSFYRRRSLKNLRKGDFTPYSEDDLLPEGLDEAEYWKRFASFMGIGDEGGVITDTLGEPLVIGPELFKDRHGHWKIKKRGRERYLKLLAQTIKDPYEIWLTPQQDENTGKVVIRRRYIKAFSSSPQDKVTGFIAFDFGKYEWSGVTAFSPNQLSYGDRVRNGILLYAKR